MTEKNPELLTAFKVATYHNLIRKSGYKTDAAEYVRGTSLWSPDRMINQLDQNENALISILGKEKFNQVKAINNGLRRFKVAKDVQAPGQLSYAQSGKNAAGSVFLSNFGGAIMDRYSSLMLNKEMFFADKNPFVKIVTQENYDTIMQKWLKSTFVGREYIESMLDTADNDFRFREDLTLKYINIFKSARGEPVE